MKHENLRRLRKSDSFRNAIAETTLDATDFIVPYFIVEGKNVKKEIDSMPGIYHFSTDTLIQDIETLYKQGIRSVLLFGLARKKDAGATDAYSKTGTTQKAVQAIKKNYSDVTVYTDVCVCGYTTHGHCGILHSAKKETLNHPASQKLLAKIALSHAEAGADFVAPSAMIDGQVRAIRKALDEKGYDETGILAYAAKFASSFYGPFRGALDSKPQRGDRKTYQMDFRNTDQALREIEQDIEEGADMVMVKPALAYLDILAKAKANYKHPLVAYNVSGEYTFVKRAAGKDKDFERQLALETLYAIKRAGATQIISYFAKDATKWLQQK